MNTFFARCGCRSVCADPRQQYKMDELSMQLEEELQEDLTWSILIKEILHSGRSKFQKVELADSGPFGKVGLEAA